MEKSEVKFEWFIWTIFTLNNLILDLGRPIAMILAPDDWFPLNRPSLGQYLHIAYNVVTPLCLYSLVSKLSQKPNERIFNLCIILFVMGASIHLVGDSITHRLSLAGYELNFSPEDDSINSTKQKQFGELSTSFELLFYYHRVFGTYMWYIPLFACVRMYFSSCFSDSAVALPTPSLIKTAFKNLLVLLNAVYFWFLFTEGQVMPLFLITLVYMHVKFVYNKRAKKELIDENGQFLLTTFQLTFFFIFAWSYYFWSDEDLRKKFPGLLYTPGPSSVYSLYYLQFSNFINRNLI